MITAPFWIVDVFTERAFGGNPLCVVAPSESLGQHLMQSIAAEMGMSETVFIEPDGMTVDNYKVRIFTPTQELGFAGHPSLGAALVFDQINNLGTNPVDRHCFQESSAKTVQMSVSTRQDLVSVRMDQGVATIHSYLSEAEVSSVLIGARESEGSHAFDQGARVVSTGLPSLMYPIADVEVLSSLDPEVVAMEGLNKLGAQTLYAFTCEVPGEYTARCFAGPVGVPEDPATGSAAGALGAHLLEREHEGFELEIQISQGQWLNRPSSIKVSASRNDMVISAAIEGGCVVVGQGEFTL